MPRFPLVLLHHAGGSSSVFRPLIADLPEQIQPVCLDLPGRASRWREALVVTANDAIDDLTGQLPSLSGDLAIFGHSLGAYLGLALVARLERDARARRVTLFASANAAPVHAALPSSESLLAASDDEIIAIAESTGGSIPASIKGNPELRRRSANLLRADFSLSASLLDGIRHTVINASIVVCAGSWDIFTNTQLQEWRHHSTSATEVRYFKGGHFYLEDESSELAKMVATRLLGAVGGCQSR